MDTNNIQHDNYTTMNKETQGVIKSSDTTLDIKK